MKIRLYAYVAVLLLACFPLAHAADLLVTNVNGYTLDGTGKLTRFRALLVDHGKVVATGSAAAMKKRSGNAHVEDGHGRTLLPGLTDAHGHVMGLGFEKVRPGSKRRPRLIKRKQQSGLLPTRTRMPHGCADADGTRWYGNSAIFRRPKTLIARCPIVPPGCAASMVMLDGQTQQR